MIKAGLNLGSSKISCIVSDFKKDNVNILSISSIPTSELKKNIIINYDKLLSDIKKLIYESEKNSQTKINSININIPAIDSISDYYESETLIGDEKISDLHLKKIINQSKYFNKSNDYYESINNIIAYELDNKTIFSNPVGNYTNFLKIYFYKLSLSNKYKNNIANLVDDFSMIKDIVINLKKQDELSRWIQRTINKTYIKVNDNLLNCSFKNKWVK